VSTLDGRLSALDPSNGGSVSWSIETGPGEMLSSSIHRLEVTALCKILKFSIALMIRYLVSVLNRALWNGACGSAEKGLMIMMLMMTRFSSLLLMC
jgi:hypothetical protein